MSGFRKLIDKEWRDVRAISIASLVLVALGTLAIRVFFLPANHPYSAQALGEAASEWFVPGMLAVYLAVIASDIVAADTSSGRIGTLALLPVPLRRVWTAKVALLLVVAFVFSVFAATCQLVILAPAGRPGTALAFLDSLPKALPHFGLAVAFGCVVLFFSTLLRRGFAVGLAAAVAVAGMIGVVVFVGERYRDAAEGAVSPGQFAAIVAGIALLFATASALTFTRGPIHASGILRRAAIGCGAVLAVLLPAGLVSAKALHDYVYFEPGEPGLRINLVSISPDGRHLVVSAGRAQTRTQHHTWIIDTETADLVALRELGLRPAWNGHWTADGLLRAMTTNQKSDLVHWFDPVTGEVVKTRSVDQLLATMKQGLQPWGRRGTTVSWPARELSVEIPDSSRATVSPVPGFWLEKSSDRLVLHDMAAGEQHEVAKLSSDRRYAHFSPNGEYISIWSPEGQRVSDGRTGAPVLEPLPPGFAIGWPGGGSPDRYVLMYGGDAPTRLHDLVSGDGLELDPDPNQHGGPRTSVRVLPDGRHVMVHGVTGTIDLRDALGNALRTLYAPRVN